MSKHTPGPWSYKSEIETYTALVSGPDGYGDHEEERACELRWIESADGKTIVSEEYGVGRADLQLMSASPEMLEALSEAWGYVLYYVMDPNTQDRDAKAVLQKMDAAIRKARGDQ